MVDQERGGCVEDSMDLSEQLARVACTGGAGYDRFPGTTKPTGDGRLHSIAPWTTTTTPVVVANANSIYLAFSGVKAYLGILAIFSSGLLS
jgi:hypothetical protein